MSILHKLFQKIEKRMISNSFYEVRGVLISKLHEVVANLRLQKVQGSNQTHFLLIKIIQCYWLKSSFTKNALPHPVTLF